jgi:transcriptional regulator with XRE-family HTH domain
MTFAQKLRQLREEKGLSEAKLAASAGLPFATVHNYGLGRRKPFFAAVVKIARALDTSCEVFADCDDVLSDEEVAEPPRAKGRPRKASTKGEGQGTTTTPKQTTRKRKSK